MAVACVLVGACLMTQSAWGRDAQATRAHDPRILWRQAQKVSAQAKILAKHMRLAEALSLFVKCREILQSLHKQWPSYRHHRVAREIRLLQRQRDAVYRLVAHEGLVEYHGKFLRFDQMQQLLMLQAQTTGKWMEMLKAQEEVRRVKTERMVEEESRRHILERREREDRIWQEQQRQDNLNRQAQRQRQEDEERRRQDSRRR